VAATSTSGPSGRELERASQAPARMRLLADAGLAEEDQRAFPGCGLAQQIGQIVECSGPFKMLHSTQAAGWAAASTNRAPCPSRSAANSARSAASVVPFSKRAPITERRTALASAGMLRLCASGSA